MVDQSRHDLISAFLDRPKNRHRGLNPSAREMLPPMVRRPILSADCVLLVEPVRTSCHTPALGRSQHGDGVTVLRTSWHSVLLVLLFLSAPAAAQSIDCSTAKTDVEKLICTTPALRTLDSELGGLYLVALKAAASPGRVVQAQFAMGKLRERCLKEAETLQVACLAEVYQSRIAVLRKEVPDAPVATPEQPAPAPTPPVDQPIAPPQVVPEASAPSTAPVVAPTPMESPKAPEVPRGSETPQSGSSSLEEATAWATDAL